MPFDNSAGSIEPSSEQFERIGASSDPGPVIMLNLLRFKHRADGIHAEEDITGAEAYARYGEAATRFLEGAGGRVLLAMTPQESVIGPDHAEWDLVIAVEYPSRSAFAAMVSDPEYLKVHEHRAAALADSRLIACQSLPL